MRLRIIFLILLSLLLLAPAGAQAPPKFRADDPLWQDPDMLPVPRPESRDLSQIYDFLENTFLLRPEDKATIPPAVNANTLGEVPDSSWFTNRIGRKRMSPAEVATGPNTSGGPNTSEPWSIISAKTQGITPGFTIRDADGVVFFIKMDPPHHPQMTTSTEVIATKFFYAFGYHVPENYLAFIKESDLVISDEARVTDMEGKERPFTQEDLNRIFSRVHQDRQGNTPVVASRLLPGRPLGPFEYHGTRDDDANDIFPHEHRRELRGLRLFAAWINHDDSRAINSLDMYEGDPGEGFVRHYLIDFGSCLGSGSVKVQTKRASHEYIIEWDPILKAAATLGIWDRGWRYVDYPDYPSIGRFEGDYFQPENWKPEYPNPAFERMLPQDAFWAARIIHRFSDEMVRAIVETGELENPEAEEYLIETLIKRRDKIVEHYLPQLSLLGEFEIDSAGQTLRFVDLGDSLGRPRSDYNYRWYRFDNLTQLTDPVTESSSVRTAAVPIPDDSGRILLAEMKRGDSGKSVRVYLRGDRGHREIVGIERPSP